MNLPERELRMREAALVLHGLHWRDRLWLLRRLMPVWRRGLSSLLKELRRLGMEPSLGCAHELPPLYASNFALNFAPDSAALARVEQATPAQIAALLRNEPPSMQARVLCLHAWPWREALWKRMSTLQRLRVLAHASAEPSLPRGMAVAILLALQDALQTGEPAYASQGDPA